MADEYIRREDALKYIKSEQCKTCSDIGMCGNCAVLVAVRLLEKVPVADVAPVVRCKDCEHARDLGFQFGSLVHESWFCIYNGPHTTGANDFCSHGQKRKEGEIEDDP